MNSLFVRLYIIIVVTILGVGLSMDYFWQYTFDEELDFSPHEKIIRLVSKQLEKTPVAEIESQLNQINETIQTSIILVSQNDIGGKEFFSELSDDSVIFASDATEHYAYKKLSSTPLLLQLKINQTLENSTAKFILTSLFYILIAIVIFFWIWPLSKDLNKLETAVHDFSNNRWQSKVELPTTSSVKHLANAYNDLLDKIKLLIKTQLEMSHSISHELRTPLARIRFSLEIALKSKDIELSREQLESISEDVSEMNQLINELLNFASLENSSTQARMEKGNISTLIKTISVKLNKNHPNKTIECNAMQNAENVVCDSYLIERALQNLIVNALKYCNQSVIISFKQENDFYQIHVEDDGSGIAVNDQEKVFESFVRLNNNNQYKGFGLGLAIAKRIAYLHNGDISLEKSNLGGAKFIFYWPISGLYP